MFSFGLISRLSFFSWVSFRTSFLGFTLDLLLGFACGVLSCVRFRTSFPVSFGHLARRTRFLLLSNLSSIRFSGFSRLVGPLFFSFRPQVISSLTFFSDFFLVGPHLCALGPIFLWVLTLFFGLLSHRTKSLCCRLCCSLHSRLTSFSLYLFNLFRFVANCFNPICCNRSHPSRMPTRSQAAVLVRFCGDFMIYPCQPRCLIIRTFDLSPHCPLSAASV